MSADSFLDATDRKILQMAADCGDRLAQTLIDMDAGPKLPAIIAWMESEVQYADDDDAVWIQPTVENGLLAAQIDGSVLARRAAQVLGFGEHCLSNRDHALWEAVYRVRSAQEAKRAAAASELRQRLYKERRDDMPVNATRMTNWLKLELLMCPDPALFYDSTREDVFSINLAEYAAEAFALDEAAVDDNESVLWACVHTAIRWYENR